MPLFNIETTSTPTLVKRYQVEAANNYFEGTCIEETEDGEEVEKVEEIK